MAWSDKPTPRQIGALLNLVKWNVTREQSAKMQDYLEKHCTRADVSKELTRIRDLYIARKLGDSAVFASKMWDDFNCKS